MENNKYHHGALKKELVEKGLLIIETEGKTALTMRKVAELCRVSPTAAYKHFKNKQELMLAISQIIAADFREYLKSSLQNKSGLDAMMSVGKAYVTYMLKNHATCEILFHGDYALQIHFKEGKFEVTEDSPFFVFYKSADIFLKDYIEDDAMRGYRILQMWSEVHGIADLIANKNVYTEDNMSELILNMFKAVHL